MKTVKIWIYSVVILVTTTIMLTGCGSVTDAIDAVTSRPEAPSGVTTVAGNGVVTIAWQGHSKYESYNVYYSTSPGVTPSNGKISEDVDNPFPVMGLNNETTYYFIVTAVNPKGESSPSTEVSAKPSASSPPFINATVLSYPNGNPSWGKLTMVQVSSTSSTDTAIRNAIVRVNDVTLQWDSANGEYNGNVIVATGAPVSLEVTIGGKTYTAAGTQFSAYPTMTAPLNNAIWQHTSANTISWSGGAPTAATVYIIGVMSTTGHFIYPAGDNGPLEVPINATLHVIPANSLPAGSYDIFTGIATPGIANGTGNGIPITGAIAGSKLFLGGITTLSRITVQ